jgi:hypothetical protein
MDSKYAQYLHGAAFLSSFKRNWVKNAMKITSMAAAEVRRG